MDLTRATPFEFNVQSSAAGPTFAGDAVTLPDGFDLVALSAYSVTLVSNTSIYRPLVTIQRAVAGNTDEDVSVNVGFEIPTGETGLQGSVTVLIAPKAG